MFNGEIYKYERLLNEEQDKIHTEIFEKEGIKKARQYWRACLQENYTDEYKAYLKQGCFEGMGMGGDF